MEQSWGMDLIRSFFATIDKAIYGLMTTIYQIILDLANATIISSDSIEDLYTRMYALLGIFMLFKVTFSFINYVINPDTFTDKSKGVQHLVKNVILVLVMIIITPFAFDKLYEAQAAILEDNLIPNFILGVNSASSEDKNLDGYFKMSNSCTQFGTARTDGDYLSLVTLRPFYQLESNVDFSKIESDYCSTNASLTPKKFLKSDIYNKASSNMYIVDYKFFLSTIVGIVVCLILISFCFDIAVRSIKLAFLQMIAPIPILSYIDPASSKNGVFSKWLKQVGSTWVSLFIRLVALFFAVLIISKLDVSLNDSEHQFWVMLFIVIGALMFAKQLPKLLEELFPGLKLGGMQLNPFKKVANDAIGGKTLLGLGAGALGLGLGSISNLGSFIKSKLDMKKDMDDIPEKSESYNKFKNKLDAFRNKHGMSDDRYNSLLERKLNSEKELIRDKYNKNFSFKHPILSNFSQTLSGAKIAFNQGKNLKFDPIEIGKQSAQVRDYKDKYSIKDRTMDKATDFFGIKNESGTTSQVKKDIKDQTDLLTRINRNIEIQNRTVSELQNKIGASNFNAAVSMDAKGNYVLNPGYAQYAGAEAANLKSVIDQLASLEQQRLDVTKSINRLEKTRDQKPPKPGK